MSGLSKEEGINTVGGGGGHVVILGAGASIASTIRNPELYGKKLPSMENFIETLVMNDILARIPEKLKSVDFEELFSACKKTFK